MQPNLPTEILELIVDKLPLNDCIALSIAASNAKSHYTKVLFNKEHFATEKAIRDLSRSQILDKEYKILQFQYIDSIQKVCSSRTNYTRYLKRYFKDPEELLDCMVANDVLISGSRALEFFCPGSIDENSDWNIYIPYNVEKIYTFMKYMESINTKWHIESNSIYDDFINTIVTGSVQCRDRNIPIKLVIVGVPGTGTIKRLIDILIEYNTSITQCFISGVAAAHMYASDTYNRVGFRWSASTEMIVKHEQRGYTLYKTVADLKVYQHNARREIVRHINDSESHIVKRVYAIENNNTSTIVRRQSTKEKQQLYIIEDYSWNQSPLGLASHRKSIPAVASELTRTLALLNTIRSLTMPGYNINETDFNSSIVGECLREAIAKCISGDDPANWVEEKNHEESSQAAITYVMNYTNK